MEELQGTEPFVFGAIVFGSIFLAVLYYLWERRQKEEEDDRNNRN